MLDPGSGIVFCGELAAGFQQRGLSARGIDPSGIVDGGGLARLAGASSGGCLGEHLAANRGGSVARCDCDCKNSVANFDSRRRGFRSDSRAAETAIEEAALGVTKD